MSIHQKIVLLSLSTVFISSTGCPSGLAEEGKDGSSKEAASLDSMWIDQETPTIDRDSESTPKPAKTATEKALPGAVAPICDFENFRKSSFVSKESWPGIGPFKPSGNDISEMTDEKQNHLKVDVNNEQITRAELGLSNTGSGKQRDVLDIEMAGDFLLESLGVKARKIADFNKELEKSKSSLNSGGKGLTIKAGQYQVVVDRSKGAQPYSCLISVNSLSASKAMIAEHAALPKETAAEEKTEPKRPIFEVVKKIQSKPKAQPPVASTGTDARKEEFVATIKSWQQIKKTALKKRDPEHLSDILSGSALAKQNTAVKWLQSHGNYYEMEPRGCVVQKYSDLGGGKKYSVIAEVREFSKYYREADKAVLKEVDDKYVVNYTVEKINDRWMITESSVINQNQSGTQSSKTSSKTH